MPASAPPHAPARAPEVTPQGGRKRFHPVCPERSRQILRRMLSRVTGTASPGRGPDPRPSRSSRGAAGDRAGTSEVAPHRVGAQPVAGPVVQPAIAEQGAMRGVVHEDRESELPRADDEERRHDGRRIRPARDDRERAGDQAPVDGDRDPALPVAQREQFADVVARQRLAPLRCGRFHHQRLPMAAGRRRSAGAPEWRTTPKPSRNRFQLPRPRRS